MSGQMQLQLQDVELGYGQGRDYRAVVGGVSLALARGQIGCLLGPSGCGKTTVLRAISGFEPVRNGRIVLAGDTVAHAGRGQPPELRKVGLMFQDYALFPHLDVADNVAFGLRRLPATQRRQRVADLLAQVGLEDHARRYPHELSGGQQQRVALARALAPAPQLLLLDEPFSNLDVDTRQRLAGELQQMLKAMGTTVLMVTHDQAEAFAMADRIGVMADGQLLQFDSAQQLYRRPATAQVASFIGRGSLLPAALLGQGNDRVLVRPEHLQLAEDGLLVAMVETVHFRGPDHVGMLRLADGNRVEAVLGLDPPAPGSTVRLAWNDPSPSYFD